MLLQKIVEEDSTDAGLEIDPHAGHDHPPGQHPRAED
jgi:hypothetical protein